MANTTWNTKTAISIAKYLNRHKIDSAIIVVELSPGNRAEIRAFLDGESSRPQLVIYINDTIDVFVSMSRINGHKRCYFSHQAIETIKEYIPEILKGQANGSKQG